MIRSRTATRAVAILAAATMMALAVGGCAEDETGGTPGRDRNRPTATSSGGTAGPRAGTAETGGSWLRIPAELEQLVEDNADVHPRAHHKRDRRRPHRDHKQPRTRHHHTWMSQSQ